MQISRPDNWFFRRRIELGLSLHMTVADIERVFSLLFGLEGLDRNLDELAGRVTEQLAG